MCKKMKFWAGMALAAFLVLLSGCYSYGETINGMVGNAKAFLGGDESSQQEGGLINENQREIYGKVISAVGNEITLALGSLKQGDSGFSEYKDNTGIQEGSNRNRQGMENPRKGSGGMSRDGMPEMDGGFGGTQNQPDFSKGVPGFSHGETGGAEKEDLPGGVGISLELTGEEASYLVPPSVPVEYTAGGQNLTLSFTRIAKDNLLKVILQEMDHGEEKIVQIQILG